MPYSAPLAISLLLAATGCGGRVLETEPGDAIIDSGVDARDSAPFSRDSDPRDTAAPFDTASPVDSAPPVDPPLDCVDCQMTRCGGEMKACQADMAKLKGCNDLIMCINACYDAACANKCVTDSMSAEGKALLTCVHEKCAEACTG